MIVAFFYVSALPPPSLTVLQKPTRVAFFTFF